MKRKRVIERSEKSRKHILDVLEILRFALNDKPCQYIVLILSASRTHGYPFPTSYTRSLLPVDVVLKKQTGFKDSSVYKKLEKDIREFLKRIR